MSTRSRKSCGIWRSGNPEAEEPGSAASGVIIIRPNEALPIYLSAEQAMAIQQEFHYSRAEWNGVQYIITDLNGENILIVDDPEAEELRQWADHHLVRGYQVNESISRASKIKLPFFGWQEAYPGISLSMEKGYFFLVGWGVGETVNSSHIVNMCGR